MMDINQCVHFHDESNFTDLGKNEIIQGAQRKARTVRNEASGRPGAQLEVIAQDD